VQGEDLVKKFMAIGRHGPVDPSEGRVHAEAALDWLPARLADGTFDCVYSLQGGGRLVIANAGSEDGLRATLAGAPDVPRQWEITELYDGIQVLRDYLASADRA
jgi:hypothetical protein